MGAQPLASERRCRPEVSVRRICRKLGSIEPVWGLNALIGAASLALYVFWIRGLGPIQGPEITWWWTLGVMVFVTERWPVELEFRRSITPSR